jgi:hypothetical protein
MSFGDKKQDMQGDATFVRFDAGPVKGVVVGDEVTGRVSYQEGHYEADPGGSPRFAVVFYDGAKRILSGGQRLYNAICAMQVDLSRHMVTITRTGEGYDTDYTVEAGRELTPEQLAHIGRLPDPDLREAAPWGFDAAGTGGTGGGFGDDDVPF